MRIRPARPDDVPTLLRLIRALADYEREPEAVTATEADLRAALFPGAGEGGGRPAVFAHVVEVDDAAEPVAFAMWFLNFSTWLGRHGLYLEDLFVHPAFRGRGVGAALLETLAAICVERGYGRFEWSVLDWNTPAIEFYRARGAVAMDAWTVHRVTGAALQALGERRRASPGDD